MLRCGWRIHPGRQGSSRLIWQATVTEGRAAAAAAALLTHPH
jgi:hypothetical protein